jgi:O-antigen/teichoic acid export membrane protein
VTAYAALSRLGIADALRRRGFARSVARTAGFNFASTAVAGLGGIIIARAVGPTVRGEYAAVTAWMGVLLTVGGMGQTAALVYYVASEPLRARDYVATSRAMMIATGTVALVAGVLLAPVLGHGLPTVTTGYRIAFGMSIVAFVGGSFTASLQARDLHRWNVVRLTQPAFGLIAIVVLWRLRWLTLDAALIVIAATTLLQLVWAYRDCRRTGLAQGRVHVDLIRPLSRYGIAQIAAVAPATLNAQLDQLVLSQTVPAADLGRYAIAVSISLLPMPLVTAIGNVAFPRLAGQREVSGATRQLQSLSVLASAGLAATLLAPLAAVSYWLVPLVFGAAYRGAVPLLWILTPGSVFLACGQVTGDLLRGRRQPTVVAWAQGIAAIFTVALLFALLPLVGVYGAAIASTVSYGVALAVMLRRLSRLSPRPRHAVARTGETAMAPRRGKVHRSSPSGHVTMTMTDLPGRQRAGRHRR